MRPKSLALLIIALGCGLVASIGITQVVGHRNPDALPAPTTEPVFIAVRDIPLNEVITEQAVRTEERPKETIPSGAVTKIEDLVGHRCRTRLFAGETILKSRLFGKGNAEAGVSAQIPKGMVVVSVSVNAVSGNAHLILPGDRVDVLVHLPQNPSAGLSDAGTRTILQKIKVFAVDNQTSLESTDGADKSIQAKTVTLLVTPEQAQKVTLATEMGQVRLVLRSPDDDHMNLVQPTWAKAIFSDVQADPAKTTDKTPAAQPSTPTEASFADFLQKILAAKSPDQPPPKPKETTFTMRVLKGPRLREVTFRSEGDAADGSPDGLNWRSTTAEAASTDDDDAPPPAAAKSPQATPKSKEQQQLLPRLTDGRAP